MNIPSVPAESLLPLHGIGPCLEVIQILEEIEIIFGRDSQTNEVFLIHGRQRMNQVIGDLDSPPVDSLIIELNRESDELNQVLALVQIAKSGCDFVEAVKAPQSS